MNGAEHEPLSKAEVIRLLQDFNRHFWVHAQEQKRRADPRRSQEDHVVTMRARSDANVNVHQPMTPPWTVTQR